MIHYLLWKNSLVVSLWIWLLGAIFLIASPGFVEASPLVPSSVKEPSTLVISPQFQKAYDPQEMFKILSQARVVYLGETHDQPDDHSAQLTIIQTLHSLNPNLIIGMEMFQRPYQVALDRYLARTTTETELQEQSQYKKRWGYSWELYAPILRFALAKQIPIIALNTPTEVTRKVARQGLESLTLEDRRFIPPQSEIHLSPNTYRERLRQVYQEIHQGSSNSENFERFFQAQVLWDETMAERIVQSLQQNPQSLVVVLVGQGHLLYGDGIPSRVTRRTERLKQRQHWNNLKFIQYSILLNPSEALVSSAKNSGPNDTPLADYFWFSQYEN